MLYCNHGISVL